MPYAYDCVQVFAHAMQSLVSTNQDVNTSSLIAAIRAVNFTGVTGQITFDVNQDRVGASYAVYNFQLNVPNVTGIANSSVALVTVGSWNNATGLVFSNASSLQLTTAGVPGAVPTDTIECDGMLVFRDDRCEACNSNEYFDTASSTCELCTGTQVQAADGVSCQYPGGIVALIVIIVLLGVGIIAAGLGFYIWRRVRTAKRAERAAESAPALPWDLQAERDELAPHKEAASGIVSTIDRSANFAVGMKVVRSVRAARRVGLVLTLARACLGRGAIVQLGQGCAHARQRRSARSDRDRQQEQQCDQVSRARARWSRHVHLHGTCMCIARVRVCVGIDAMCATGRARCWRREGQERESALTQVQVIASACRPPRVSATNHIDC
jgi:hypothetical protein